MAYNYITNINSPNYWKGRTSAIKGITLHWWGLPEHANPEGVVNWLCNRASQVSAHLVVTGSGRRAWQLVNDSDTAWHALSGNASTIGIEADPRCRDEDYDVLAEVIANLWRHYGKLPIYKHSHWVATQCPGNYDMARVIREAEAKLNPPKPTPAPKPVNKPVPNAVELSSPIKFKTKLDKTEVWDLTTNPNYKSTKTLKKGEEFVAFAKIDFNNAVYYVTEYSFGKNWKRGVNQADLVEVKIPTPTPAPTPAPKPTEPPVEIIKPVPPTDEELKQQEENTAKFRAEMERLSKENNVLLKAIHAIVQSISDLLKRIFK